MGYHFSQAPNGSFVPLVTKRITMPIGSDGSDANSSWSDICQRTTVTLPVTTTRWRLRIANASAWNGTGFISGALTLSDIYVGTPALSSEGGWDGAFTAAPSLAAVGGVVDGTEFISSWVTAPDLQFQEDQIAAISTAVVCQAGASQVLALTGYCPISLAFQSDGGAAAQVGNQAPPTGTTLSTSAVFLDTRLEYECVTDLPVVFFIGDSTTLGLVGDTVLNPAVAGTQYTWPGAASLKKRFLPINAAINGSTYAMFLPSQLNTWTYTRFDFSVTVPDAAVLAGGINESGTGTPLSTWATNMQAVIQACRTLGISRFYETTVMSQPDFSAGTITAGAAAGVTSLTTSSSYASGTVIYINTGQPNYESLTTSAASTGSGPYTTTFTTATVNFHLVGENIGILRENLRQQYNAFSRAGVGGIEGLFDFDAAIPSWTYLPIWWRTSVVHPGPGAYALFAGLVDL